MPLDASRFPVEVQVAFFIHDMLSDKWDGMSGSYLGKDWTDASYLMQLYEVDNPRIVIYFAKMYERINIGYMAEEAEKRRKAEERKSKAGGGGKTFTHSVKG